MLEDAEHDEFAREIRCLQAQKYGNTVYEAMEAERRRRLLEHLTDKLGEEAARSPLVETLVAALTPGVWMSSDMKPFWPALRAESALTLRVLCVALQHESARVRRNAAEFLGELNEPAAVEALIQALQDWEEGVRFAALCSLTKLGGKRALQGVVFALLDQSARVTQGAIRALGSLGDRRAIPYLEALQLAAVPLYLKRELDFTLSALRAQVPLSSEEDLFEDLSNDPFALALSSSLPPHVDVQRALAMLQTGRLPHTAEILTRTITYLVKKWRAVPFSGDWKHYWQERQILTAGLGALGEWGDQNAIQTVLAALACPDRVVRGAALSALRELVRRLDSPALRQDILRQEVLLTPHHEDLPHCGGHQDEYLLPGFFIPRD